LPTVTKERKKSN